MCRVEEFVNENNEDRKQIKQRTMEWKNYGVIRSYLINNNLKNN